ncbi:MAG: hypothetical protein B6U72_01095 [Candidatus Altiarchaeales archaeon ex4484_2]|nr:MAG: hypothetical protein B6U72_01095 [Candidatus Altiarchaeales archaeon ex4484_2]
MKSPLQESDDLPVSQNLVKQLSERFRNLRVWDYYSISKIKNSMYCPAYLYYLSKGLREKKIKTPEGVTGSQIHEKLDVTEKRDVEPSQAAVYNIYWILDSLHNTSVLDKSTVLTELPYFSPTERIWGYPDVLFFHNNGCLTIDIIERKTRMRRISEDGTPYIFAGDVYQLHVQKRIIEDILEYTLRVDESLPQDKISINCYLELRKRNLQPAKTTAAEYVSQLEHAVENLTIKSEKHLEDNHYNGGFTMPVLFNKPFLEEEPLYCKIDADLDDITKRFGHVKETLFRRRDGLKATGCICNPGRRRYCGYSHLCDETEKQTSLSMFTSL